MNITDRVSTILNQIDGRYLLNEIKIIDNQVYNIYELASMAFNEGYNDQETYDYLKQYFGSDISAFAILQTKLNQNAKLREYKSLLETIGFDDEESSRLARSAVSYFEARKADLKEKTLQNEADNETRQYYLDNYMAYVEQSGILKSNLNLQTRDLMIDFQTEEFNIYNTLTIFQEISISEAIPFIIAINYDGKVYSKIYELYETDTQKTRILNTFDLANEYILKKQSKISKILEKRQKYSLDVFQLLTDQITKPDEFLKSYIVVGVNSTTRRNADLLIFKFGQKLTPLHAKIHFPSSVHPKITEIEEILNRHLLPYILKTYSVGKYKANLIIFGININPSLLLDILEPPYDQYISIEEINSLLSQRQKINYTYLNDIPNLDISVKVVCSFTGQGRLKKEEIIIIDEEPYILQAGTPFINFSMVKANHLDDLNMVANLLEVLLVNYYMLINNLKIESPLEDVSRLTLNHWGHFQNARKLVLSLEGIDIFSPTRVGSELNFKIPKRIEKLREIAPDIIDFNYSRKCAGNKQPNVVPYDESPEEDETMINLPINDPKYTFICDKEQYPYATLVYSDKNLYPCCSNLESSNQIEEAIRKYENAETSTGSRRGTIKPLAIRASSQAIPADLTRVLSSLSNISLTRVGVSKKYNLITAVYYSLTSKHLSESDLIFLLDRLDNIEPSICAEQLWDSYETSIMDVKNDKFRYKTHFRIISELFSQITGNNIDILAISGDRLKFKFVYPRFNRYLAWRPNKSHKILVVYEHDDGSYDALINSSSYNEDYTDLSMLVDIFNESIVDFALSSRSEKTLPNDVKYLAQMIDQFGHIQYLKFKYHLSNSNEEQIYYVARFLEAPRNLPVFNDFSDAPSLEQLIKNLKHAHLLGSNIVFLTSDQFPLDNKLKHITGLKTNDYTFISNNLNDKRDIDLETQTIEEINLPIKIKTPVNEINILYNLLIASQLKYIISWLLQTYKKNHLSENEEKTIQEFINTYFKINDNVIYDFEAINDYLYTAPNDLDIIKYLTSKNVSFVSDNKIEVSNRLHQKLFGYCKSIYNNVAKDYLPFKYQFISNFGKEYLPDVSFFYDQSVINVSEIQRRVYLTIPSYLTQFDILTLINDQYYILGLYRYKNIESFLKKHPELIEYPRRIDIFTYNNLILVHNLGVEEYQKPDSIITLRARPENGKIDLITDNEYYYEIIYNIPKELK